MIKYGNDSGPTLLQVRLKIMPLTFSFWLSPIILWASRSFNCCFCLLSDEIHHAPTPLRTGLTSTQRSFTIERYPGPRDA